MNWVLDFDDTLAVGANTWALTRIFPETANKYDLPFDHARFIEISLRAQQHFNESGDDTAILDEMFRQLSWPARFKDQILTRMFQEYIPSLYEDTLPFLQRLAAHDQNVAVISNNNHAPLIATQLGINHFFTDILTPSRCSGARGKPSRDMWDFAVANGLIDTKAPTVIVGDDPWSEGAFADACGNTCWILDRLGRYASLRNRYAYRWAISLLDIPLE